MRTELRNLGFDIGNSCTPVVLIIIGDDMRTVMAWWRLIDAGVYVNVVLAPGTPVGRQLLRTSYMATHTDEQLDRALDAFARVGKELGII